MDLFGIGPLEVLLVVLLALILFGPKDIADNARSAGRFLNRLYKSEGWRTMVKASTTLRNLPHRLAREAELDEVRRELTEPNRPAAEQPTPPAPGMTAWIPGAADAPPPSSPPTSSDPD